MFLKQNKNGVAHVYIIYLVSLEISLRMLNASVPWEGVKYILIFIFLSARQFQSYTNKSSVSILLYVFLLLPSIALTQMEDLDLFRKELSFNLSGPISLAVSVIYFSNKVFTIKEFRIIILLGVLPLITAATIIFLRIPSLSSIVFNDAANFKLSGNYGPNQVATIFGYGIVLMMVAFFLNIRVTTSGLMDRILIFIFFTFCVINFSRGGIFTAIISILLGAIVWLRYAQSKTKNVFLIGFGVIIIFLFFLFNYFDNITGNSLSKRYAGSITKKDPKYENFGSGVTGRDELIKGDFALFQEHIVLGVGVGMAKEARLEYGHRNAASHTELTRLLSEHGLFGLGALLILLLIPIQRFFTFKAYYRKLLIVVFVSFSIIASLHAAMRLCVMGFVYGLAFINLMPDKEEVDASEQIRLRYLEWGQYEEEIQLEELNA
ncbi:MAG: O-antigen ligase family protein [Bacteroidota bacterium]|nr:O-antigen ligase family protein [Bacteroidota bacterium]